MRHLLVRPLIIATTVALSPPALSSQTQPRQIGGGVGLTLFADRDFRGRSATIREDTPDFTRIGMNDVAQSLRVGPGEHWEVCEHINYQGRCVVVSGAESDLSRTGWSRIISSARLVRTGGRGRGVTPPVQPSPRLELFSNVGFSGTRREFTGPESNLTRVGFNDQARSLRIRPGDQWQVCVDANFINCLVVNTDWRDLNGLGMSRRISSVRPWQQGGGVTPVPRTTLVLFADRNFRGQSLRLDTDQARLAAGFTNRAQSVQVVGAGSWQLCDRTNFSGRCVTVSADLADLSSIGLARRVQSVRRTVPPR